jgi:AmmeMemoRadiSam system protein B
MADLDDSRSGSGRIIIPGAEPEAPTEAPRIIVPPGARRDDSEDLPEYPRLRPLILMPFNDGKRDLVLVNDPLGVIPGQPVLGIESVALLQLMDGTVSLTDITAAMMRESKDLRVANMVHDFVAQLDRLLMLESPRFEAAYLEIREQYHRLEIRPAVFEGHSYPADPAALRTFLDEHFAEAERLRQDAGEPERAAGSLPRALDAPHLDPRRAGPAIARSFLELPVDGEPLRVVAIGTGHSMITDRFALTRKEFETPLGRVSCDTVFVDAVARRLGDDAYHAELAHRDEHSLEFMAVYLKHRFGDRPVKWVPILCGGFHDLIDRGETPRQDPGLETLIDAVRETERALGGRTVYLASIDFSHVGTRFGDAAVDDAIRAEIKEKDHAAIDAARRGDADAWFTTIAAHKDSTRICGFAPNYVMLRCAEPGDGGRLLRYEQSEEKDGSMVSVASLVWG